MTLYEVLLAYLQQWGQVLLTIAIAVGGWMVAFWVSNRQVRKTFERSARLADKQAKCEMSMTAADEMIKSLREMERAYGDFVEWISTRSAVLKWEASKLSIPVRSLADFQKETVERWRSTVSAGTACGQTFESRQVILNRFLPFHDKLSSVNLRFIESIGALFPLLSPRAAKDWDALKDQLGQLKELSWDVTCYTHDFIVGLQNEFHSPLYGYLIPRRQPTDPRYKVLSVDLASFTGIDKES
ncbi:MAG TPA: hypothetical protein VGB22_04525 [candidate division Zixibacteria bacterium]